MYSRYYPDEYSKEQFFPADYESGNTVELTPVPAEKTSSTEKPSLFGNLLSGFDFKNLDLGDILLIAILFLLLLEDGVDNTDILIIAGLVFFLGI